MSNNTKQTKNIYNISGVEDLSHDTAANIQGGFAMTAYQDTIPDPTPGNGNEVLFQGNVGGLRTLSPNADNQFSSVTITDGQWTFYDSPQWIDLPFLNDSVTLGPGTHNFNTLNNSVSSFRRTA